MAAVLMAAPLLLGAEERVECVHWRHVGKAGRVDKKRIDEASGLAVSRQLKNVLWTHNDQPGDERVFALDFQGELVGQLDVQVDSLDWEDIALGPCGTRGGSCLYVADIGGSQRRRKSLQVLRFAEPELKPGIEPRFRAEVTRVEIAHFRYADGKHRDAEALMVEGSRTLWLIDKNESSASLFRAPFDRGLRSGATFRRVATRADIRFVTAADMTPDGSRFVVRNLDSAYEFVIRPGQDVAAAFQGRFEKIDLREEDQGEAIGYGADGLSFFTLGEGKREPIHRYVRTNECP
jgi:hypothetical protein